MFRLTKRLDVLIETLESINAHLTSSSPPLQFWLIGVQASEFWNQFFSWTSLVERLCARMGVHFQSVHSQQRKRRFSGLSRQKNATYVQRRVCVILEGFNKNVCNKSYWCCKFRLLKLQYRLVLWDKMTVKQNPRKNESLRSHQMGRFRKWNYRF